MLIRWFSAKQHTVPDFAERTALRPAYPTIDQLIEKAQRTTESCVFTEQINISAQFFKEVAVRGLTHKKYTVQDAERVGIIVDFISRQKTQQIESRLAV